MLTIELIDIGSDLTIDIGSDLTIYSLFIIHFPMSWLHMSFLRFLAVERTSYISSSHVFCFFFLNCLGSWNDESPINRLSSSIIETKVVAGMRLV